MSKNFTMISMKIDFFPPIIKMNFAIFRLLDIYQNYYEFAIESDTNKIIFETIVDILYLQIESNGNCKIIVERAVKSLDILNVSSCSLKYPEYLETLVIRCKTSLNCAEAFKNDLKKVIVSSNFAREMTYEEIKYFMKTFSRGPEENWIDCVIDAGLCMVD